jgi:hypothetical protein
MILEAKRSHLLCRVNFTMPGFATVRTRQRNGAAAIEPGTVMSAICFSHAEVTSINKTGFWLQFGAEELYLPFVEFPRFEHATVAQITSVVCASSHRLYWPALDLDLPLDAIRNPFASECYRPSHDC